MTKQSPPTRTERLGRELALCAIEAEALARRVHACEELRPSARWHAEKVAEAAFAVCEAAIAVAGCTPDLRMIFGQYVGGSEGRRALLAEVDEVR